MKLVQWRKLFIMLNPSLTQILNIFGTQEGFWFELQSVKLVWLFGKRFNRDLGRPSDTVDAGFKHRPRRRPFGHRHPVTTMLPTTTRLPSDCRPAAIPRGLVTLLPRVAEQRKTSPFCFCPRPHARLTLPCFHALHAVCSPSPATIQAPRRHPSRPWAVTSRPLALPANLTVNHWPTCLHEPPSPRSSSSASRDPRPLPPVHLWPCQRFGKDPTHP
jgi:hypothetical protein